MLLQRKKSRAKGVIYPVKKEHKLHGQKTPKTEKTAKQLLGELYSDKEYLEKLLKDEGMCVSVCICFCRDPTDQRQQCQTCYIYLL